MRASMDSSLGGLGNMGMGGGMSGPMMYGMMGMTAGNQGGAGMGFSDWGTQVRPVSYTPPAIAYTPHFGMYQVQQTLLQAGLGGMGGPIGGGVSGAITNFRNGGVMNMLTGPNAVPNNITMAEYMGQSARSFGDRAGDIAAVTGVTAGSTLASAVAGGAGAVAGASALAGRFVGTAAIADAGVFSAIGMGALAGGLVAAAPVSIYAGHLTDMMAENRAVQTALASGSFRFYTGNETDPTTGRGFNRRTRANIASDIQNMEMRDVRYGASEYKDILEGGMALDLFSGTRDAEDFKGKFKGLVENLKTVTSTMHTSLKEGLEVIRGFRDMGVTDPGEVNRLTMTSEMRGRMSGRTGMEMMAIGQTGADIFRGTGISMERGFELNQMNATTIRNSLNAGTLSREMIAQAGGENALAQQMTGSALAAFQSAHGRAAMMANYNPTTGAMNPNLIQNLASGDVMGQISRASGMGAAGLLSFQANQEEIISKMSPQAMQMMGVALDAGVARQLQQAAPGLSFKDAMENAMMRRGLGKPEREAEMAIISQDPEKLREQETIAVEGMRVQAYQEDLRNRYGLKAVGNYINRTLFKPISDSFMAASTAVGEATDDLYLKASGVAVVNQGMLSRGLIKQGQAVLDKEGEGGGIVDVSGGSGLFGLYGQSGAAFAEEVGKYGKLGESTGRVGEKTQEYSYKGTKIRHFENEAAARAASESEHVEYMVAKDKANGGVIGVTRQNVKEIMEETRKYQPNKAEREAAEKTKMSDNVLKDLLGGGSNANLNKVFAAMTEGVYYSDFTGDAALSDKAFKEKYGKSKGYYSALVSKSFDEHPGLNPDAEKQWNAFIKTEGLSDLTAAGRAEISKEGDKAYGDLKRRGLLDFSVKLSQEQAAVAYGDDEKLSKEAKLIKLGIDPDTARKIGAETERMAGTDIGKRVSTEARKVAASAALANSLGQAATGSTGVVDSKTLGNLSQETTKILEAQSTQLLENYKQLIALQEKLSSLSKGGR